MFITIRFGADEEELFNPDCPIRILLENVKKRCNCVGRDCIGFVDEKGGLVSFTDDRSMDSAVKHFTHRAVYTLIAMTKKGELTSYIPLVDDPSKELLIKLESLSNCSNRNIKVPINRRGSKTPQNKPSSQMSGKGRRK